MKHTPKPWIKDDIEPSDRYRYIMNGNGNGAVYIAKLPLSRYGEEQEANASLISAAPDLLEACKRLLDAFYEDPLENDTASAVELAYDAIAKATGEEQ